MLDQAGAQNFFSHLHELWIQPEIDRRKTEDRFPDGFQIRECLIRLPKDGSPIVEFNDEFGWKTESPELAPGIQMEIGKPIYLHNLIRIGKVLPPMVNNERVAFVYLYWDGWAYSAVFDFSPTWPDFNSDEDDFQLGEIIAHHIGRQLVETSVQLSRNMQSKLNQIGLWTVTALLPYPISKIVENVGTGRFDEARRLLVDHCDGEFVSGLVETWANTPPFDERMAVFREAVFAHRKGKYRLSIHTLIPQIEGVLSDWLYMTVYPNDKKRSLQDKVKDFQSAVNAIPKFDFAYREALDSVTKFLLDGPPLQRFMNWLDAIDPAFPGRHVVTHGKYVDEVFTEENSIKLFLLLDTICQFVMFFEARKQLSPGENS